MCLWAPCFPLPHDSWTTVTMGSGPTTLHALRHRHRCYEETVLEDALCRPKPANPTCTAMLKSWTPERSRLGMELHISRSPPQLGM